MKRLTTILALLTLIAAAGSLVHGASPLYVTPDVPTTVTVGGTTLLPWQIFRYDASGPTYTLALTVPGQAEIDAIHKLDAPGAWIFSVRAPSDLGGSLPADAEPHDIIRYKGGVYSLFFCPAGLGVPSESNLDGVYLEGGDNGSLVVSFDVPVQFPPGSGAWYEPADLVRFVRTGTACGAWTLSGANPAFDASASGAGIPNSDNVIDADRVGGKFILSLDVPSTLAPSAGPLTTYEPGQLASWDGVTYDDFEILAGWPAGSKVDGFSCMANPGLVPATIKVNKATSPPTDVIISWSPSCADGAQDYAIYQGTIGSWYSHKRLDCNDAGADRQEQVTPASGGAYYLVVPMNYRGEGSYGARSSGAQRPVGTTVCASPQMVTSCP